MPAWRMISTASSTLKALTSSRLRCFSFAMIRLVDFDARRDARVVELGGPGLGMLHLFGDLVARIDGLHRAFRHAHGRSEERRVGKECRARWGSGRDTKQASRSNHCGADRRR